MKSLLTLLTFLFVSPSFGQNALSIEDKKELPPNGVYKYDMAFAEWGGKSMGVKLEVIIKGDSIKVIYKSGSLSMTKVGDILSEGVLRKHKSGQWIISTDDEDVNSEEIGGCSGGPTLIDFKTKQYWTC